MPHLFSPNVGLTPLRAIDPTSNTVVSTTTYCDQTYCDQACWDQTVDDAYFAFE